MKVAVPLSVLLAVSCGSRTSSAPPAAPLPAPAGPTSNSDGCANGGCLGIRIFDAGGFDGALCSATHDGTIEIAGYTTSGTLSPTPGLFWVALDDGDGPRTIVERPAEPGGVVGCAFDVEGDLRVLTGLDDVTVSRIARTGAVAWATKLPLLVAPDRNSTANATGLAVDAQGNAFVIGDYAAFAEGRNVDAVLFKIDPQGNLAWTASISTPSSDGLYGVAADSTGDAYVVGFMGGGAFVRKFSPSGDVAWTRDVRGGAWAVAVDPSGPVYVASTAWPTTFLSRIESTGVETWTLPVGDDLVGVHVAVDPRGAPWMIGSVYSGPSPAPAFAARVDPMGAVEWLTRFGTGTTDEVAVVAFDAAGDGHVAGSTSGSFAHPGAFVAAGGFDTFVAEIDPAGHVR